MCVCVYVCVCVFVCVCVALSLSLDAVACVCLLLAHLKHVSCAPAAASECHRRLIFECSFHDSEPRPETRIQHVENQLRNISKHNS